MMFSLVRALFSPASAEDRSSLFGWFIDSMARSDSSEAYMSTLWLWAFADRPRSLAGRGAPEVSRFSCMLFLSVRGFSDYAGPSDRSRLSQISRCAFLYQEESRRPDFPFFEAQSPGPPIPLSTLRATPRDAIRKTEGQDGVAVSFLVGLFHSLQHAGLTRRSPDKRRNRRQSTYWAWWRVSVSRASLLRWRLHRSSSSSSSPRRRALPHRRRPQAHRLERVG